MYLEKSDKHTIRALLKMINFQDYPFNSQFLPRRKEGVRVLQRTERNEKIQNLNCRNVLTCFMS